jgi:hypothetical protein
MGCTALIGEPCIVYMQNPCEGLAVTSDNNSELLAVMVEQGSRPSRF